MSTCLASTALATFSTFCKNIKKQTYVEMFCMLRIVCNYCVSHSCLRSIFENGYKSVIFIGFTHIAEKQTSRAEDDSAMAFPTEKKEMLLVMFGRYICQHQHEDTLLITLYFTKYAECKPYKV